MSNEDDTQNDPKPPEDQDPKPPEDQIQEIRDALSGILENAGLSVVVFTHPDAKEPQVWRKGHWYDSAALLNEVLAAYRHKAAMELGFLQE